MSDVIKPLPEIPEKLRQDAQRGVLIPFIGAGASRIAGCPDWDRFATQTLENIIKQGKLDHSELEQIKTLNPRIRLSIASSIAKKHSLNVDFSKMLKPVGYGYNDAKGCRLYASLSRIGNRFVTTNYDEWLDTVPPAPLLVEGEDKADKSSNAGKKRKLYCKAEEFKPVILGQADTVVHLHGSVTEPDTMVMTTKDYVAHYANDRNSEENPTLTFLDHLFKNYTVLFIGYGLAELEILEYVIQKAKSTATGGDKSINHYILQGFFSHEEKLMKGLKRYYLEECETELIPFSKDEKNWDQLLDVLDDFATALPAKTPLNIQKQFLMDELLDE